MLIIILILVLLLLLFENKIENYNPEQNNVQYNFNKINDIIKSQQKYKKNLSVAISTIPTIQCNHMFDEKKCNKYGCNWFDGICSSIYPMDY